jgi:WD40 repeat protein
MKTSRPVTWHPDGIAFATANKCNYLEIYEFNNNNNDKRIQIITQGKIFDRSRRNMMNNDYILCLQWNKNQQIYNNKYCDILAMGSIRYLRLWKISNSNDKIHADLYLIIEKTYGHITSISWNYNNNSFSAGYQDGTIILWDSIN